MGRFITNFGEGITTHPRGITPRKNVPHQNKIKFTLKKIKWSGLTSPLQGPLEDSRGVTASMYINYIHKPEYLVINN